METLNDKIETIKKSLPFFGTPLDENTILAIKTQILNYASTVILAYQSDPFGAVQFIEQERDNVANEFNTLAEKAGFPARL